MHMKKIFFYVLIVLILLIGFFYFKNTKVNPEKMTAYKSEKLGISFEYPKILNLIPENESVILHHEVPYKNTGDCDMMGDEKTYDNLTDFEVKFRVFNMGISESMKKESPYIPEENFVNRTIVPSPGFIDEFNVGVLSGYSIYEGAEGCGHTIYYLKINPERTLVINKKSIQHLSGVRGEENVREVLKTPNVISKEEAEVIFMNILGSMKID